MADKAEILSEAEVDFLLAAEKGDQATASGPIVAEDHVATMRGDLEQINLADIFQTLGMSKMEGVLRIRNPLEERQVYCRDGFVRMHVPGRIATRRLGQRLLQAGLVDAEQLRKALVEQKKVKKPIGQVLVDNGTVAQESIDEIIAGQIAEDLFSLFTWQHGTFEFFKGAPTQALLDALGSCPEYEFSSLLLEVARRSDEWSSILTAIGSLDEIPLVAGEPTDPDEIGDLHRDILRRVDGATTYRELCEQATQPLFEVARAARDLVRDGALANVDEATMVAVAANHVDTGNNKRALVILQTLRDRGGDRPLSVLQGMAKALEKAGERRLAGSLLLEAAQRHTESSTALDLARAARTLTPHDVGTLSFLRTVLVAHAPADSPELEKCTLDLLDALVEADLVPTALEIIDDARRTSTIRPAILMREVRARQKGRDVPGAVQALEELARLHDERGERQQANDAYDALLRLDRSRKDVQKLLTGRRRTRLGNVLRLVAAATVLLMLSAMGLVYWQQQDFAASAAKAEAEITALLTAHQRGEARERLLQWEQSLGACELIEDLRNRIAFADAAESGRLQKALRARFNSQLATAAGKLDAGEFRAAIAIYLELAAEPKLRDEAVEAAHTRIDALLAEIALATKGLQVRLPTAPDALIDRQALMTAQADLHAICRLPLLSIFEQFDDMVRQAQLPPFLSADRIARIDQVLSEARPAFARARVYATGYADALARNEHQRQLDPLFKAAVEREKQHDFAQALAHYRELERQTSADNEMRAHFRDRVARNAMIVRLLEALREATTAGDYATAHQQLRALRMSFPDVPFDTIALLPLRVLSWPTGARVVCNGKVVGQTPLLLARRPADTLQLVAEAQGFRPAEATVHGDGPAGWEAHLLLPPARTWRHDSAIEVAPLPIADGTLIVDRGGNVSLRRPDGDAVWTFRSGDLSGLLTRPAVHANRVHFGSLDGGVRALDLRTGDLVTELADVTTELSPVCVDGRVVVATSNRKLLFLAAGDERATLPLPAAPTALLASGSSLFVMHEGGMLLGIDAAAKAVRWQRELAARSAPQCALVGNTLFLADDHGNVAAVDAKSGDVRWQRQVEGETLGAPTPAGAGIWLATRTHLRRLDPNTGNETVAVPAGDDEWSGPALGNRDRVVTPLRHEMQVVDATTGERLYRIAAGKRARLHAVGSEFWVLEADRTIKVYPILR